MIVTKPGKVAVRARSVLIPDPTPSRSEPKPATNSRTGGAKIAKTRQRQETFVAESVQDIEQ